jgi:hypothetical protein
MEKKIITPTLPQGHKKPPPDTWGIFFDYTISNILSASIFRTL